MLAEVSVIVLLALACSGPDAGRRDAPDGPQFSPTLPEDPGRRPLGRLNAAEYDATVRALFGTSLAPGRSFPPDETAWGFDNMGAALTTSSIHVELWEAAASELLA